MAQVRWYLNNSLLDGWQLVDQTAATAATCNCGWVVGTGSTNSSELQSNTERASSTFVGNTVPDGTLDTTLKDAFRSQFKQNGAFAAGNWTFQFAVVSTVQAGAADGQIVFRILKADADGSNATEITTGQQATTVATNVGATDINISATWAAPAWTITEQYIFVQVAWKRTGAGGMTTTNIRLRTGSSTTVGTTGLTADFTPTIPVPNIPSGSRVFKPRIAGLPTLRQILFGQTLAGSSTQPYNGIMGHNAGWAVTETEKQVPWPCTGVFRNLVLEVGAAASFTLNYALRINGVSTALNVTIDPATSLTAVATAEVEVTAGDLVSLYYTFSGGTPGNTTARWSLEFESGTVQESGYAQPIGASANDAAPRQTGGFAFHATAAAGTTHLPQQVVAVAGTITKFYVRASANPGASAGMTWYFNVNGVRQDGSSGTPNTACAVINATLVSSSFSLSITPGDLVMVEGVSTGTFSSVNWAVSHNFLAADPRHSVLGGSTGNITALTQATPAISKSVAPIANNTAFTQRSGVHTTIPVTFKGMRVYHQTAPGVGHFRIVQLWAGLVRGTEGATTGLTTTVTDTEQTQSDLTHEYTTATAVPPDQLNMRYEEDGTAAGSFVSWGFAQINPTVPASLPGDLILGVTLATSASLFQPTVAIAIDAQAVTGHTVAAASQVFAPTNVVVGAATVVAATIASGSAVNAPTVVPQAVTEIGATIPVGSATTAPTIAYNIAGATIYSTARVLYTETLLVESFVNNPAGGTQSLQEAGRNSSQTISGHTGLLSSVSLQLRKSGSPTDALYLVIRESTFNGTVLDTSVPIQADVLTTSLAWVNLPLYVGITLSAGTTYWIETYLTRTVFDGTNLWRVGLSALDPYAGGEAKNASGTAISGSDFGFRLYTGTSHTVALVGGGDQGVTGETIPTGSTLTAPTIVPGAITVVGDTVATTLQMFASTVAPGAVTVVTSTVATTSQVFAPPSVAVGAVTVIGGTCTTTLQVFAPSLQAVALGASIGSTSGAFAPTVAVVVTTATLGTTSAVFAPTVAMAVTTSAIAVGSQVFASTVAPGAVTIVGSTCASTLQLFVLTASPGAVTVVTSTIAIASQVFAVTVAIGAGGDQAITGMTLAAASVLTAPSVALLAFGATISAGSSVTPPTLALTLTLATLVAGSVVTAPTVAVTLVTGTIAAGSLVYSLTVVPGAATVIGASMTTTTILFTATVATGAVTVVVDTIPGASTVSAPTVAAGAATVEEATILSGSVVTAPTVEVTVEGGTILAGSTVTSPTVATEAPTILAATISATTILLEPLVTEAGVLAVVGATCASTAQTFVVSLAPGAVTISASTIVSAVPVTVSRFYLPSAGTPLRPTLGFGTGWNKTSQAARFPLASEPTDTGSVSRINTSSATSPEFHLCVQYQSDPLAAQTFSGTLRGQISANVNNVLFNGTVAISARVVAPTGTTIRGQLFGSVTPHASQGTATPPRIPLSTFTNRSFRDSAENTTLALSPVAALAGDLLVIEIGSRDVDTGASRSSNLRVRDVIASTDLPINDTSTGTLNPWVEFSVPVVMSSGAVTEQAFAPTVSPGAVTVVNATIAVASQAFAPTVTVGAATVFATTLAVTTVLFPPTLFSTATLGTVVSTTQLFAPTATAGAITIVGSLVGSTGQVFAPTITLLAQVVTAGTVTTTAQLSGPVLSPIGTATGSTISSTLQLIAPTVIPGTATVMGGTVISTGQFFAPLIEPQTLIETAFVASTVTLTAPTLATGVADDTIQSTASLFGPMVAFEPITEGIGSTLVVFAPDVTVEIVPITVGGLDSTVQVFPPSLARVFPPTSTAIGQVGVRYLVTTASLECMMLATGSVHVRYLGTGGVAEAISPVTGDVQVRSLVTSVNVCTTCLETIS